MMVNKCYGEKLRKEWGRLLVEDSITLDSVNRKG